MTARRGVRYEADSLLSAAEQRLLRHQLALSSMAPPWDGYCGLVQLRDDDPASLATATSHQDTAMVAELKQGRPPDSSSSPFARACQSQQQEGGLPNDHQVSGDKDGHEMKHMRTQHSTAEAESCFREAVQLIKRSQLAAAKSQLQKARELCPPDQLQAIQRIDRFAAAVQKAL
ncbi:hypothetical protein WJX73_006544 [Symbiochloris irregularis]|uniref:Uncharacterized protein n=1 Tax=Symbiochloris irregularis TaxID=706552 RepID=A0AAW1PNB0_9CHLO